MNNLRKQSVLEKLAARTEVKDLVRTKQLTPNYRGYAALLGDPNADNWPKGKSAQTAALAQHKRVKNWQRGKQGAREIAKLREVAKAGGWKGRAASLKAWVAKQMLKRGRLV